MVELGVTEIGTEVERQWKRVEKYLSLKTDTGNMMGVIEAQKIFEQVLNVMSYGPTVEDKINNAYGLFEDEVGLMATQQVYKKILTGSGYTLGYKEARKTCDALMKAILNMVGQDFEPLGLGERLLNWMNFFWGHHPRFLNSIVLFVLSFVAGVWFLADTVVGQWVVRVGLGFARFVMASPVVMIGLVVIFLIGTVFSHWASGRRRRR